MYTNLGSDKGAVPERVRTGPKRGEGSPAHVVQPELPLPRSPVNRLDRASTPADFLRGRDELDSTAGRNAWTADGQFPRMAQSETEISHMTKRSLFLILPVALYAGVTMAANRDVVFKISGLEQGAAFQANAADGFVSAAVSPGIFTDGSFGYIAEVHQCDVYRNCNVIYGRIPATAVRRGGGQGQSLTVNIDPSGFIEVWGQWGTPVAMVGTFTPYTGPNSVADKTTGTRVGQRTFPDGSKETFSFSGEETSVSANFVGTVGPILVSAPQGGSNGTITTEKGTQRRVITSAP